MSNFTQREETGGGGGKHSSRPWPPWAVAFTFALISGLTLPLGAALGIFLTPEAQDGHERKGEALAAESSLQNVAAGFLAFGGGSLLFAVTIELYGSLLDNATNSTAGLPIFYSYGIRTVLATSLATVIGAALYIYLNRKLESHMEGDERLETEESPGSSSERNILKRARRASKSGSEVAELDSRYERGAVVAASVYLGVVIDGLPEGIMLGFLAAERRLSMALVISLFIANFPDAFSAAILMRQARRPVFQIVGQWTFACVLTAILAAISCLSCPTDADPEKIPPHMELIGGVIEGLAAGAMLSCIASVMIPEAFKLQGDVAGFLLVCGFVSAVCVKILGFRVHEVTNMPADQPSFPAWALDVMSSR